MDFEVHIGKRIVLDFVLKDDQGNVHPDPAGATPAWTVDDPSIGELDTSSGDEVHFIGKALGSTKVSAVDGPYSASATGTVIDVPLTAEIDAGAESDLPTA